MPSGKMRNSVQRARSYKRRWPVRAAFTFAIDSSTNRDSARSQSRLIVHDGLGNAETNPRDHTFRSQHPNRVRHAKQMIICH